jgi:hypothetical protein
LVGLRVGPHVEHGVGSRVGPADASFVGFFVGSAVGPADGPAVGSFVGPPDGAAVGLLVGSLVGPSEGSAVGAFVGSRVGPALGALVGSRLGDAVGSLVGYAVGLGVVVSVVAGAEASPEIREASEGGSEKNSSADSTKLIDLPLCGLSCSGSFLINCCCERPPDTSKATHEHGNARSESPRNSIEYIANVKSVCCTWQLQSSVVLS